MQIIVLVMGNFLSLILLLINNCCLKLLKRPFQILQTTRTLCKKRDYTQLIAAHMSYHSYVANIFSWSGHDLDKRSKYQEFPWSWWGFRFSYMNNNHGKDSKTSNTKKNLFGTCFSSRWNLVRNLNFSLNILHRLRH